MKQKSPQNNANITSEKQRLLINNISETKILTTTEVDIEGDIVIFDVWDY